jgi:hypothetical protein
MSVEFEVDPESLSAARDITSALRYVAEAGDHEPSERYQSWAGDQTMVLDPPETEKKAGKVHAMFTELAQKVARDVDLKDIAKDVSAHEELQRIATVGQISLPVLQIGDCGGTIQIPCLFSPEATREVLGENESYLDDLEERTVRLAVKWFGRENIRVESREKVNGLFFDGLESFLATRISGSRWSNSERRGSGGIWQGLFKKDAGDEGQWWNIVNRHPGLVLYWANQYGVRVPAINIGGRTKPPEPFKVFLRHGNGHIGADANPNNEIAWDESLVCVPSKTPTFATNHF